MNTIEVKVATLLKSAPVDTNREKPAFAHSLAVGDKLTYKWIRKKGNHYLMELTTPIQGRFNWYVFVNHVTAFKVDVPVVTKKQVEYVMGRAITAAQFKALDESLKMFNITTVAAVRHFLSQVAHESGGLRWMIELAMGASRGQT
jgi:hypothetical protein